MAINANVTPINPTGKPSPCCQRCGRVVCDCRSGDALPVEEREAA